MFNASNVELGSSASKNPSISISQFKRDPKIRILCEIDLSPGQSTSPDIELIGCDTKFKIYLLYMILFHPVLFLRFLDEKKYQESVLFL